MKPEPDTPEDSTSEYGNEQPKKKKLKKPRKPCAGRKLMRWSPEVDQFMLLALIEECAKMGIELPWERLAKIVDPSLTPEGIKQHLSKVSAERVVFGQRVPEQRKKRRSTAAAPQTPTTKKEGTKLLHFTNTPTKPSTGKRGRGTNKQGKEEDDVDELEYSPAKKQKTTSLRATQHIDYNEHLDSDEDAQLAKQEDHDDGGYQEDTQESEKNTTPQSSYQQFPNLTPIAPRPQFQRFGGVNENVYSYGTPRFIPPPSPVNEDTSSGFTPFTWIDGPYGPVPTKPSFGTQGFLGQGVKKFGGSPDEVANPNKTAPNTPRKNAPAKGKRQSRGGEQAVNKVETPTKINGSTVQNDFIGNVPYDTGAGGISFPGSNIDYTQYSYGPINMSMDAVNRCPPMPTIPAPVGLGSGYFDFNAMDDTFPPGMTGVSSSDPQLGLQQTSNSSFTSTLGSQQTLPVMGQHDTSETSGYNTGMPAFGDFGLSDYADDDFLGSMAGDFA